MPEDREFSVQRTESASPSESREVVELEQPFWQGELG